MGITFRHAVNSGDLIASLAGIKQVCENIGEKAIIYQELDRPAEYYQGATHPVQNEKGIQVSMNKKTFEMMYPLIMSLPYVEDFRPWKGEKVIVDLDVIRTKLNINLPYLSLSTWIMFAFPDMAADISKEWINVVSSDTTKGRILINFTERYRNYYINYFFLKEYKDRLAFIGTLDECKLFCHKWDLEIEYLAVDNFLDLAQCIRGADFFLGNQSMCWNIANAMGTPRIVEICSFAPNCQPFVGNHNYGFYHQEGLEYYFNLLSHKK